MHLAERPLITVAIYVARKLLVVSGGGAPRWPCINLALIWREQRLIVFFAHSFNDDKFLSSFETVDDEADNGSGQPLYNACARVWRSETNTQRRCGQEPSAATVVHTIPGAHRPRAALASTGMIAKRRASASASRPTGKLNISCAVLAVHAAGGLSAFSTHARSHACELCPFVVVHDA